MNNGFLKWFSHFINAYIHCIFLLTSSYIQRIKINFDSDSQLSQGYLSAFKKDGLRSFLFFLASASFPLDFESPLYDPFSGYLYQAKPSCWVGTQVASSRQPSFPKPQDNLLMGYLTPFSYHHKHPSFHLLEMSLVGVSIFPSDAVRPNNVSFCR